MSADRKNVCPHCAELHVELAKVRTIVERIDHELLGNGQPGRVEVHSARIERLERWKSRVNGALAVIGGLVSVIGSVAGALAAGWLKRQ